MAEILFVCLSVGTVSAGIGLLCDTHVEVARLVVEMRLYMWYEAGNLFMDFRLMYAAGINIVQVE
jgi:hypothetical protein